MVVSKIAEKLLTDFTEVPNANIEHDLAILRSTLYWLNTIQIFSLRCYLAEENQMAESEFKRPLAPM